MKLDPTGYSEAVHDSSTKCFGNILSFKNSVWIVHFCSRERYVVLNPFLVLLVLFAISAQAYDILLSVDKKDKKIFFLVFYFSPSQ